jgi:hypothetical protein
MTEPQAEITPIHLLFALIGLALMLFVGVFVFASTLIAPWWAVLAMGVAWVGAAGWAWSRWRTSKFAPLLAAVAVAVVWIVVVTLGDEMLGWAA